MHPGAQELFYVLEGTVTAEIDGRGTSTIKAGEVALIPAEVQHLVRNDSTDLTVKALAVHCRADKDKPLLVVVTK
jgi:quercetin dioxygenase-like cupin family protein